MGTYDALGPEIKAAVDQLKQNSQPAMTDHAQRAREVMKTINNVTPEQWDLADKQDYLVILSALTQAHAAGRRAGLELVAKEMEESGNDKLSGWIKWCRGQ